MPDLTITACRAPQPMARLLRNIPDARGHRRLCKRLCLTAALIACLSVFAANGAHAGTESTGSPPGVPKMK